MTVMQSFLAHAGEDHGDSVESARHLFEADPFVAVPVALAIMILVPWLVHVFTKSKPTTVIVALIELFFIGVLMYSTLPVLSVISLTAGFILAFVFAFSGISGGE